MLMTVQSTFPAALLCAANNPAVCRLFSAQITNCRHMEFCCRRGGRSPFNGPYPLNREFSLCTIATNTDRIHPCTAFEYYRIARIHKCSDVNNFYTAFWSQEKLIFHMDL